MNGIGATRTVTVLLVLLPACAPSASDAGAPGDLPLLALTGPSLEIGVVEGDEAYTFAAIESVLRLADGSIAVSDGDPAASRIVLYDESGTFLRAFGGRGEGPGEFRTLSRIYALGSDSLMAADNTTARLSVFGLDGGFARQLEGVELSRDSTFRLDSWMYGRFWIDGALRAADRTAVSAAIDRLPPPRSDPGYRSARVASDGGLWVREPDGATWTSLDPDGDPVAAIRVPARFTPMDVRDDEVLGRWLGPSDVHFVRVYPLTQTGERVPVPAWLQAAPAPAPAGGPTDDELDALMRESIIDLARSQEIHYSRAFTYTTTLDSLDSFDPPAGLGVSFTHAHTRGWAAVFTHPTADRLCGLAYGVGAPPGWQAGGIVCGPRSASPAPPGG